MNGINKMNRIITDIRFLKQVEIDEIQQMINNQKAYIHPFKQKEMKKTHDIAEHNQRIVDGLIALKNIIEDFEEVIE
ncbi:hypothetical protein ACUE9N_000037 [Listeria monocytogenes]|nr:hypothetical protein [Listeria monocytogenes]